jgi:predicted ATP-grasp superfamily ATP-dependent carboligase
LSEINIDNKADRARRVLVLDGSQRSALAVVRSLGAQGIEVTVGEERIPCLASRSKFAARAFKYTSPKTNPAAFIADIVNELERDSYDIILPMTDTTMILAANEFEQLALYARLPISGKDSYLKASDKAETIRLSQKLDIPTPKTFFINKLNDLGDVKNELKYPVVIKPQQSKSLGPDGWIDLGVDYASSFDELTRKMERYKNLPSLPMIQERIFGPGIGAFLLFNRGVERAVFFHRRIREKPPSGGVSVLRESISPDPIIREYSVKILKELNWHGVAMVEFKVDGRDNTPRIMEINARFWGSLQLAIDAGVDFPFMLYKMITEGDVPPVFDYKTEVKLRWLLGDQDHLLIRVFKSDAVTKLPPGYPGRLATLIEFLKFYQRGMNYEILKSNDPGPFLMELKEWFRLLGK